MKELFQKEGNNHEILFNVKEGEINFGIGAPDISLLQISKDLVRESAEECLSSFSNPSTSLLQYGPVDGHYQYLSNLKDFLSQHYEPKVESTESLFITSGATFGLALICSVLGNSQTTVYAEDPCYFIAGKVISQDFGMNIIPVKTDHNGMDTDHLEELFQKVHQGLRIEEQKSIKINSQSSPRFSSFIYLVPTFNNPRGTILSLERRKKIIEIAYKYNALVICDDVYELLSYKSLDDLSIPPRLVSLDNGEGRVISNCSFSKIFGPGVRLGWIEAKPSIISTLKESGISSSGGSANQFTSVIFANLLKSGRQNQILDHLKKEYSNRLNLVSDAIAEHLPECKLHKPKGGYFMWIEFNEDVVAEDLLKFAKQHKVFFQPGNWSSSTHSFRNCIRISIAFNTVDKLVEGIKLISLSYQDYKNSKQ